MSGRAHLLVLVVTLFNIGFILRLIRRRQLRAKYAILWLSIGVGLVGISASPALLDRLSMSLGISYGPTTFFLGAITLLFLVAIHFSWELSRLEERSRTLAEEVSLLRASLEATDDVEHPPEAYASHPVRRSKESPDDPAVPAR